MIKYVLIMYCCVTNHLKLTSTQSQPLYYTHGFFRLNIGLGHSGNVYSTVSDALILENLIAWSNLDSSELESSEGFLSHMSYAPGLG